MWLLSQGSWVQVIAPEDLVEELRSDIERMLRLYLDEQSH